MKTEAECKAEILTMLDSFVQRHITASYQIRNRRGMITIRLNMHGVPGSPCKNWHEHTHLPHWFATGDVKAAIDEVEGRKRKEEHRMLAPVFDLAGRILSNDPTIEARQRAVEAMRTPYGHLLNPTIDAPVAKSYGLGFQATQSYADQFITPQEARERAESRRVARQIFMDRIRQAFAEWKAKVRT